MHTYASFRVLHTSFARKARILSWLTPNEHFSPLAGYILRIFAHISGWGVSAIAGVFKQGWHIPDIPVVFLLVFTPNFCDSRADAGDFPFIGLGYFPWWGNPELVFCFRSPAPLFSKSSCVLIHWFSFLLFSVLSYALSSFSPYLKFGCEFFFYFPPAEYSFWVLQCESGFSICSHCTLILLHFSLYSDYPISLENPYYLFSDLRWISSVAKSPYFYILALP